MEKNKISWKKVNRINSLSKDIFGYECKMKIHASEKEKYSSKDCVLCKVIGFRKGRLELVVSTDM